MIPHSESLQSKSMEFRFLSLEDVLELHEMQLESYGGATGVRDSGLLESAVMIAQASFGGEYVSYYRLLFFAFFFLVRLCLAS
jgi:prophage maintenance system killer protein